jgi:hypothetical protein
MRPRAREPPTSRGEKRGSCTSCSPAFDRAAAARARGLVRIALKKPFSDGTVAVDLDPLSLLCRLVAFVPADLASAARFLRQRGEPTEPPSRAPARAPPYWQSKIVRRHSEHEQSSQLGCSKSTEPRLHGPPAIRPSSEARVRRRRAIPRRGSILLLAREAFAAARRSLGPS